MLLLSLVVLLSQEAAVLADGNATLPSPVPVATKSNWDRFFAAYTSLGISSLTCLAAVVVQQVASRSDVTNAESIGSGA